MPVEWEWLPKVYWFVLHLHVRVFVYFYFYTLKTPITDANGGGCLTRIGQIICTDQKWTTHSGRHAGEKQLINSEWMAVQQNESTDRPDIFEAKIYL